VRLLCADPAVARLLAKQVGRAIPPLPDFDGSPASTPAITIAAWPACELELRQAIERAS
jgi:hypothetical protein